MTQSGQHTRTRFDPLAMAPAKARARYANLAERAKRQPQQAIKLKCLECMGWEYAEAKACTIRTCGLFEMNRRIFGRGAG